MSNILNNMSSIDNISSNTLTSEVKKDFTIGSEDITILEMKRRLPRLFNSFRAKRVFLFNKTNHTDNGMEYMSEIFLSKSDNPPNKEKNILLPSSSISSSPITSSSSSSGPSTTTNSSMTTPEHDNTNDDPITKQSRNINNREVVLNNGLDDIYENEDIPQIRLRNTITKPGERKESRAKRNMKAVSAFMTTDVPHSIQGLFQRKPSTRSLRLKMNPIANKEKNSKKYTEEVCIEFSDEEDDYNRKGFNDTMKDIEIVNDFQQCTVVEDMPSTTNFSLETENHRDTNGIASFVLNELMTTEQSYVRELASIVDFYILPFENLENTNTLPLPVRGKSSLIFGNLRNLLEYHNNVFLSALMDANNDIPSICRLFISERNRLLSLYRPYCQNKSQSETFRREYVEGKKFFNDCQRRAKHLLPLSAYLLKPIQRITKYQLLLKELSRHCDVVFRSDIETAIAAMLDLLSQLNADMQQLRISGFNGDLSLLGCLRLHTECEVMSFKKKNHRFGKLQRRFILLFDHGVVLCKKRNQPITLDSEYYEFKILIPLKILGFSEFSKAGSDKFEIWDNSKNEGFAITILDDPSRMKWIQRIGKLLQTIQENKNVDTSRLSLTECRITEAGIQSESFDGKGIQRNGRPQSWTSVDSTASSKVSSEEGIFAIDPNGNRSSIASIDESNEDELYDNRDIVDNNSSTNNHVTTIMVPSTEQDNEISSNNVQILDTRSISEGQLQTMNGGIVVSESADCVSAAC
uniref:DH domain-containing protein n=1 Tax=Strongyloides venezuelensis TaxID=75913 RepID=A0A0K0F1Y0_STRVS